MNEFVGETPEPPSIAAGGKTGEICDLGKQLIRLLDKSHFSPKTTQGAPRLRKIWGRVVKTGEIYDLGKQLIRLLDKS